MIGFETLFRGETINIASDFGVTILIYNRNGHYHIEAGALDESNMSYKWIDSEMELGEVLEIEVKELASNSEPILIKRAFTNEVPLTEKEVEEMFAEKLDDFYSLEKYLKEEGLL